MAGPKKSWAVMVAEYSGLALAIPAGVVVGYIIGYLLDKRFGTHGWSVAGVILGAVGGLLQVVRYLMRDMGNGDGNG